MLKTLKKVSDEILDLLKEEDQWHSLNIDFDQPIVKRVWREWGEGRIMLHKFAPCGPDEALFHPHPWPAAIACVRGSYETGLGFGTGLGPPEVAYRTTITSGVCYEMVDKDLWHYIQPTQETYSLMVSGAPWNRDSYKSAKKLVELDKEEKEDIMFTFKYHLERWPIKVLGAK